MLDKNEEEKIINKLKSGDVSALSKFYAEYSSNLINLAYKITGNISDAEEITQESFIKALKNINKFNEKSRIFTWLYTITKNLSLNHLKIRKEYLSNKLKI